MQWYGHELAGKGKEQERERKMCRFGGCRGWTVTAEGGGGGRYVKENE